MVGKKWRKAAAVGIAGVLAVGVLTGCGSSSGTGSNGKMKIGVVQIVQHSALDESNRGFVDALAARGLKDKIEIDQQNAQGDQSNLRSIANRFVSGNYNLICAISTPAAQAMANATNQIPIICTAIADYENAKLMKSEEVPDANVTGTHDRGPLEKQVSLIREIIFIPTDNIIASSIPTLMSVANKEKIPVFGAEVGHVKSGVLASESISFYDIGKRAGQMAADILEGKKQIRDFPVEGAANSKLYINKAEMENLGIQIPKSVLDRAELL